jgi:hypothetical protein
VPKGIAFSDKWHVWKREPPHQEEKKWRSQGVEAALCSAAAASTENGFDGNRSKDMEIGGDARPIFHQAKKTCCTD